jgi:hypothetical protein
LQEDILPSLKGEEVLSSMSFPADLWSVTAEDAKQFWEIDNVKGERAVLPAALILRKV